MKSWYEVRVDGVRVAASEAISPETLDKAYSLMEEIRLNLYRDKVLQIIAVGSEGWEETVHEEHPTVLEN